MHILLIDQHSPRLSEVTQVKTRSVLLFAQNVSDEVKATSELQMGEGDLVGGNFYSFIYFIFFSCSLTNACCDPSFEPTRRDGSNGGSQEVGCGKLPLRYHCLIPVCVWSSGGDKTLVKKSK